MYKPKTFSKLAHTLQYQSRFSFAAKIYNSGYEALKDVKDGSTIMFGGFGLCGIPENSIRILAELGAKNLTCISNNCGSAEWGLSTLLKKNLMKRMISSYAGDNHEVERQYLTGQLEFELIPQGTLAEKCRAQSAGIPAFFTPTGLGTVVEHGGYPIKLAKDGKTPAILSEKRQRFTFNGKDYLLEHSLKADFAIVKAKKADTKGNLVFNKTARNFNSDIAGAATVTIAEVEEIVEAGTINPDEVHCPGVFVKRIFKGDASLKKIEKPRFHDDGAAKSTNKKDLLREKIAKRAVKEVKDGMYVNLGIGMPTLVPAFLDPTIHVEYQSENGVLGMGNYPRRGQEDPDLINAGKETITVNPGASYFSSSTSFGIIRGRHLDLSILGGMEVSETGDLANWIVPGKMVKGMGGAMDLVSCGSKIIVLMEHTAKGAPKIIPQCTLPITGKGVVSSVITEQAVFEFKNGEMILTEIAKEVTLDDVKRNTTAKFHIANNLGTF